MDLITKLRFRCCVDNLLVFVKTFYLHHYLVNHMRYIVWRIEFLKDIYSFGKVVSVVQKDESEVDCAYMAVLSISFFSPYLSFLTKPILKTYPRDGVYVKFVDWLLEDRKQLDDVGPLREAIEIFWGSEKTEHVNSKLTKYQYKKDDYLEPKFVDLNKFMPLFNLILREVCPSLYEYVYVYDAFSEVEREPSVDLTVRKLIEMSRKPFILYSFAADNKAGPPPLVIGDYNLVQGVIWEHECHYCTVINKQDSQAYLNNLGNPDDGKYVTVLYMHSSITGFKLSEVGTPDGLYRLKIEQEAQLENLISLTDPDIKRNWKRVATIDSSIQEGVRSGYVRLLDKFRYFLRTVRIGSVETKENQFRTALQQDEEGVEDKFIALEQALRETVSKLKPEADKQVYLDYSNRETPKSLATLLEYSEKTRKRLRLLSSIEISQLISVLPRDDSPSPETHENNRVAHLVSPKMPHLYINMFLFDPQKIFAVSLHEGFKAAKFEFQDFVEYRTRPVFMPVLKYAEKIALSGVVKIANSYIVKGQCTSHTIRIDDYNYKRATKVVTLMGESFARYDRGGVSAIEIE